MNQFNSKYNRREFMSLASKGAGYLAASSLITGCAHLPVISQFGFMLPAFFSAVNNSSFLDSNQTINILNFINYLRKEIAVAFEARSESWEIGEGISQTKSERSAGGVKSVKPKAYQKAVVEIGDRTVLHKRVAHIPVCQAEGSFSDDCLDYFTFPESQIYYSDTFQIRILLTPGKGQRIFAVPETIAAFYLNRDQFCLGEPLGHFQEMQCSCGALQHAQSFRNFPDGAIYTYERNEHQRQHKHDHTGETIGPCPLRLKVRSKRNN